MSLDKDEDILDSIEMLKMDRAIEHRQVHDREMEQEDEETDPADQNDDDDEEIWYLAGKEIPKSQIVFFFQVCVLYVVIITCIINLSLHNGDSNLWTALLSSSLGLMLPGPGFRFKPVK